MGCNREDSEDEEEHQRKQKESFIKSSGDLKSDVTLFETR
jgi:hypothetical protein